MIFRNRATFATPPSLSADGLKEVSAAKIYYTRVPCPSKNMDFSAYKALDVRVALNALFDEKCAYCEGKYLHHPFDVEHFRPKGEVAIQGGRKYPGYWWLAAEWSNLFIACIDCNRKRYHSFDNGDTFLFGKENKFPIAVEADRAFLPGQEMIEIPLLINPSLDDPAIYLVFKYGLDPFGQLASNVEAAQGDHKIFRKGDETIKTFGLNRPMLVKARAETISRMALSLDLVLENLISKSAIKAKGDKTQQAKVVADFVSALQKIYDLYARSDRAYSAACDSYFRMRVAAVLSKQLT